MKLSLEQKTLINDLIKKLYKSQEDCEKKGHVSENEWFSYQSEKLNGICTKCEKWYQRLPTSEEREKYLQRITEPYTI